VWDAVDLDLEAPIGVFLVAVAEAFLAGVDLFFAGAANAGTLKQNVNRTATSREQEGKNVIVSRDPTESLHFLKSASARSVTFPAQNVLGLS
jgi:hypothetical protein